MPDTPEQNSSGAGAPPPTPPSQTPPPPQPPPSGSGAAPPPSGASPNRTIMMVLSYLSILALVPLLAEKEDQEVQWHAKHGLVLLAAEVVVFVGLWILSAIIGAVLPVIGCLFGFIPLLLTLALLVLHIVLIVKAVNGERMRLPVITDFAEQWR